MEVGEQACRGAEVERRLWNGQEQGRLAKLGGRHFWEGQIGLVGGRWEEVVEWDGCHFHLQAGAN